MVTIYEKKMESAKEIVQNDESDDALEETLLVNGEIEKEEDQSSGNKRNGADMTSEADTQSDHSVIIDHPNNVEANRLIYGLEDVPSLPLSLIFGLQQVLLGISGSFVIPTLVVNLICAENRYEERATIISTSMFACGIGTLLQSFLGLRIGIFQGGSIAFIAPVTVMMMADRWRCSSEDIQSSDAWMSRMQEIQGNLMLASFTQVILGCTGVVGAILRYIGPLTIAPTIILIGLPLTDLCLKYSQVHWGVAVLNIALIIIFSLFLGKYEVPFPACNTKKGCYIYRLQIFQLFSIILATAISWIFAFILTESDVLPGNSTHPNYRARTDALAGVIHGAPWFYWPYPFQFGLPTVSIAGYIGFLAACIASMIESLGDYYAAARMAHVAPPPAHAINRGLAMEGVGGIVAGMLGSGHGTTSYSQNISSFAITKVASRRIFLVAGLFLIIFGCVGKFGAFLSTMPEPIIGSLLTVMLGILITVGFSVMKFTDMDSSRNFTILGLSIMMGMILPRYVTKPGNQFVTGYDQFDQIMQVLLGTPMLVGGLLGFILDNIIPGTEVERGIKEMLKNTRGNTTGSDADDVYQLPWVTGWCRRSAFCSYFPVSPTFRSKTNGRQQ